ncbi:MDR family MFS transporter [Segniliparus rugosus]|uniref:Drug:H+ antiporter-2 (14 Spanner) (DHA2) family drug resistance MFS transporter n=1 Tax=Segniliparus rugosus (strain ATCC BAA-974 / DSM 45345 / CCUG 50838 / CIP 108380 / JCM 13579 / CDC 945) TaxID=679197 RepID=E5XMH6_SEGRC|nr:MDR family MFS transporter [Segniliparus rugosus]EFV14441.1 drug:H+ antiporter-2 (14 Spanner) (DHA2) family drug resistance MFS transporter [Segniliparus rugosus ATCC BAA-974]
MSRATRPPLAGPTTTSLGPVLAAVLATMLLAALDQMIFSTAQPTIVGELHGVDHQMWIATAYMLASTVMMPIYGKFSDVLGRKPLYLWAMGAFLAGSVIGGLADTMGQLIAGRAVQGIGGGGLMILSQAIIADVVPPRQRGKYMGMMGGIFGLASVLGPLLGGWFTEGPGWRWAFWMNLPLGAFAIAATLLFLQLPASRPAKIGADVAGMLAMAASVSCLVLATSLGGQPDHPWGSAAVVGLFAAAAALAVVFVLVELRAENPIIPMRVFAVPNVRLAVSGGLIVGVAMFGSSAYLPTYLQMVTGLSTTKSGLLMIPMMLGMVAASSAGGAFTTRTGRYKILPALGTPVIALGLCLSSTMKVDTSNAAIAGYQFLLGAGIGMCMQTLVLIVQNSLPQDEVGTATATHNFFRQIGMSLGASLVGGVFVGRLHDQMGRKLGPLPPRERAALGGEEQLRPELVNQLKAAHPALHDAVVHAFNSAMTPVFAYLVPLVAVAFVAVLFVREVPLRTTLDAPEDALAAELPATAVKDSFRQHCVTRLQLRRPAQAAAQSPALPCCGADAVKNCEKQGGISKMCYSEGGLNSL